MAPCKFISIIPQSWTHTPHLKLRVFWNNMTYLVYKPLSDRNNCYHWDWVHLQLAVEHAGCYHTLVPLLHSSNWKMISKLERCCTARIVKWCKSWGDKLKTIFPLHPVFFMLHIGVKIVVCILHQQKGLDRERWATHRVLWTWAWLWKSHGWHWVSENHYSHLVRGSFLAGKTAWALTGYLPMETFACLLNEWA